MGKGERAVIFAIVILLGLMAWAIISTAAAGVPKSVHIPNSAYPDIPRCDLPLWERIKDRCR